MRRLSVVLATDASYAMPTRVAMRSFLVNSGRDIDFTVLVPEGFDESLIPGPVTFIHVDRPVPESVIGYISDVTFYRLFIPELLDHDEVLYVDSDVICLRKFPDVDVSGVHLAGVDFLRREKWVNAGVLFMNLGKMREDWICGKFMEAIPGMNLAQDEYVINKCCERRYLPLEWNFAPWVYPFSNYARYQEVNRPYMVHFCGPEKPWMESRLDGNEYFMEWRNIKDLITD